MYFKLAIDRVNKNTHCMALEPRNQVSNKSIKDTILVLLGVAEISIGKPFNIPNYPNFKFR